MRTSPRFAGALLAGDAFDGHTHQKGSHIPLIRQHCGPGRERHFRIWVFAPVEFHQTIA